MKLEDWTRRFGLCGFESFVEFRTRNDSFDLVETLNTEGSPTTTPDCERGFSDMSPTITEPTRIRLTIENVSDLMFVQPKTSARNHV